MSRSRHRLVDDYLGRLDRELSDLPRDRRREIVGEIEAHIHQDLAQLGHEPQEHEVIDILERVGDPATIASEVVDPSAMQPSRAGALEVVALILLLIGAFIVPIIGWVAGVVLLWISTAWNTRDKLLGTLVVPGGLALPFFLTYFVGATTESCSIGTEYKRLPSGKEVVADRGPTVCTSSGVEPWLMTAIIVALAVATIVTVVYLGRKLRRSATI